MSIIEERPIEHPADFGENAEITHRFVDRDMPEWRAGQYGPRFLQRPMPPSRDSQYGPPFEVRPGPLPREYLGIKRRLSPSTTRPAINGLWDEMWNQDTTCSAWCATHPGGMCADNKTPCVDAGLVSGSWAGDVAKRCEEKCRVAIRPADTSAPTLISELQGEAGRAINKTVTGTTATILSITEFESLKRAYADAKRVLQQLSSSPLAVKTRARVAKLQAMEGNIDHALNNVADGRNSPAGLGNPWLTVGIIAVSTAGAVSIAYFVMDAIRAYLTASKTLTLCFDAAKKLPAADQTAALEKCVAAGNNEKVPDWLKGAGIALVLGVAGYIAYRVKKGR